MTKAVFHGQHFLLLLQLIIIQQLLMIKTTKYGDMLQRIQLLEELTIR